MDFHPVAVDTASNILPAVKYILDLDISPDDKRARIAKVINLIGSDFYTQMFDANSEVFDSSAIGTTDYSQMTDQIENLATKLVRQHALSRVVDPIVQEFYDSALGKAQEEAFRNAISLDKHPTLTRSLVGETCKWCRDLVGTHVYPDGKYFARHDNCDCLIVVSGYNSRNGILNNYRKVDRRDAVLATSSQTTGNSSSVHIQDVTEKILKNATPRVGSIRYAENWPEGQKVSQEEQLFANWLLNTLGGTITHIPTGSEKTPDYDWNATFAELKTLSTKSLNALSHKIREASTQAGENGIVFLDLTNTAELWKDPNALYDQVQRDLKRFEIQSILIKRGDKLMRYYTKNPP